MNNKKFYSITLGISALLIMAAQLTRVDLNRRPASSDKLTLQVQSLTIPPMLKVGRSDSYTLKLTVNRAHEFELTPNLRLNSGERLDLTSSVVIDPKWLRDGNLEFKIELVKLGMFKQVVFRCSQVSKGVEEYNRSYQCTLPSADKSLVLVYSLKRVPLEGTSVASN